MSVTYSTKNVTVDSDAGEAVFTVDRTGTKSDLEQATSVRFRTADLSARHGTDYTSTSGVLAFAAGETRKSIDVVVLDEAFDTSAIKTFLLELERYGSATATLSPDDKFDHTQGYWLIPGDGNAVRIPTKDSAGAYAKAQMDVSDFSDPPEGQPSEKLPHTYFRLGHARPDMNFPERLIASSPGFFATAKDDGGNIELGSDDAPREPGAALEFMKPRNIDREVANWQQHKDDNKHLDGIFLYTEGSMTTSTLGAASYVINGDHALFVGGETRLTYMNDVTTMYLSPTDGITRYAQGAQTVDGETIDYEIKALRSLEVALEDSVKYTTSAEFAVNTDLQIDVFTGIKYEVKNGVNLEVSGIDLSAKCDILGNYEIDYMAGEQSSTRSENSLAASEKIVLQIDPAGTTARKAAVMAYTATNMTLAAAAAVTAAVPFGSSQRGLEKNFADSNEMNQNLAKLLNAGYPASFATLAGIGAAMAIGVVAAQAVAAVAPNVSPKISMTPLGITLSAGGTTLDLSAAGILIDAPDISIASVGAIDFEADDFTVTAATSEMTIPAMRVRGNTSQTGVFNLTGDMDIFGVVEADNVIAEI